MLQHAFRCTFIIFSCAPFLCLVGIRLLKLSLLRWKAMFTFKVCTTSHALQPGILRPKFAVFLHKSDCLSACLACVDHFFLSHVNAVYQCCFDKTQTLGYFSRKMKQWNMELSARLQGSFLVRTDQGIWLKKKKKRYHLAQHFVLGLKFFFNYLPEQISKLQDLRAVVLLGYQSFKGEKGCKKKGQFLEKKTASSLLHYLLFQHSHIITPRDLHT